MSTGTIQVKTENIFPVIKKFLYSDHEIFLRELVSNAVDATKKLQALSSMGEFNEPLGDLTIDVLTNEETKTLTIRDHGIGMNAEEAEKYIAQVAFSGAEEFVQRYNKSGEANLIGHFGLGFYSSFMVSSKVEIFSKSYRNDDPAIRWECDGNPEYVLEETDKSERGTDVVLHIAEDATEFLEKDRIKSLLKKYCKFLPIPIRFENEIINNTMPAWTRKPSELAESDYTQFYRELYPFADDPLFHIHLNVDYPFHLTGILYFPKLNRATAVEKDRIQLYSNQVFVTDNVENIVPEFLTLLKGVIDSPDIPLNVSRSYLQNDSNVRKISAHISKKVADKLEELFKENRNDFEQKWDDIRFFIQYGIISDEKFYERAQKFCLFKTTENKYFTFDELMEKIKPLQTDKNENVMALYCVNPLAQHSFVKAATDREYTILWMDSPLDSHFISFLEHKNEHLKFARVDADSIDKLIDKGDSVSSSLSADQEKALSGWMEKLIDKKKFDINFEALSPSEAPMIITRDEWTRRASDLKQLTGQSWFDGIEEHFKLIVNANHPIVSKILLEPNPDQQNKMLRQVIDLAMLSQNMLHGEALTDFVNRSVGMME